MKQTINDYEFHRAFEKISPDNFTYDGLEKLFEYLEQYEADCGIELELDVIEICCDFTEYENIEEFQENYGKEYETIEDIEDHTSVIPIDDERFIIQNF